MEKKKNLPGTRDAYASRAPYHHLQWWPRGSRHKLRLEPPALHCFPSPSESLLAVSAPSRILPPFVGRPKVKH